MYKCQECGFVFDYPKEYSEDLTPGGSFEGGSFIYHYDGCPNCSSTDYEEIEENETVTNCNEKNYYTCAEIAHIQKEEKND